MKNQSKVQIDHENYKFINRACRDLNYKSISEYMREAINGKISEDRKKIREKIRAAAMEMIGEGPIENLFESIEGEDFLFLSPWSPTIKMVLRKNP